VRRGFAYWRLTGIHRRGSIQHPFHSHVDLCHDARRPSAATDASNLHRPFVGVGSTLLGSGAPLAPRGSRSLAGSSHHVNCSFIPAITYSLVDHFLVCGRHPSWKRLISYTLAKDQRIPLITKIFSDPNEVKMIMQLSGDDAQALIDMIPWVRPHNFTLEGQAD